MTANRNPDENNMTRTRLRPIGSDMEVVDEEFVRSVAGPTPWDRGGPVAYVETGRQALMFVAQQLWEDGCRTLLVPDFLCDSMLAPFLTLNWEVVTVAVRDEALLDLDDLERKAGEIAGPFAALVVLYFGRRPDERYRAAVQAVQSYGGVVIDDETHRVFTPGEAGADIAIASLRKLLPVADGAYLRGRYASKALELSLGEGQHGRWIAMEQKRRYLHGCASATVVRELFDAANECLEQIGALFLPSARTAAAIPRLDYEKLGAARVANARSLQLALAGAPGLRVLNNMEDGLVPSHVVIAGEDAHAAQQKLAAEGLYCPIHWPSSELLSVRGPWPTSRLSIPIDHRYSDHDMMRVSQLIRKVWSS